jgi:hypothetical protein
MKVGAELCLLKLLSANVQDSVQKLTTAPNVRRLHRALSIIDDVCAELKDNMRYDLGQLIKRAELSDRDCNTVFYLSGSHCTGDYSGTRLCKSKRTIDVYTRAGAELRVFKILLSKIYSDASKLLTASKSGRIKQAADIVNAVCAEVDANMFEDFPKISSHYATMFYDESDNPSFFSMSDEMRELMKETIKSLSERINLI